MANLVPIHRALLSVSDTAELATFARALAGHGVELISTGGTAARLREAGLEVTAVADVTGFPEMMEGRVKTLHPAIHGALLARRNDAEDATALAEHAIETIDLVCVNLYPFEQTIRDEVVTEAEAIEQIDIGGPAMIRSAAKNHARVTVVTSPCQYERVLGDLQEHDGATTGELRRDLAAVAFTRTAAYDTAIGAWMTGDGNDDCPAVLHGHWPLQATLRYGENPHQRGAVYVDPSDGGSSVVTAEVLHGRSLSWNNLHDAAAALALVEDLHAGRRDHSAAAVVKHANPCGAARHPDPLEATRAALAGDERAAYGGILALSRMLDEPLAGVIAEGAGFLEVIVAPAFDEQAVALLGTRWKNVRLLAVGDLDRPARRSSDLRTIPGGLLVQDPDAAVPDPSDWTHAAGPAPDESILRDAEVLVVIVKHLSSNAVAIGRDGRLLGAGSGQVDRLAACRHAIDAAGEPLGDCAVATSDAFFPFPDGPELLVDAGVACIIHPGGSKRDEQTFALCEQRGVTCLVTGTRHFRH